MEDNKNNTKIGTADALTFSRLALALANDYESVYYLNSEDNSYIEYGASGEDKELMILSHGDDFFADTIINCKKLVYKEDQEIFLKTFRKDALLDAINSSKSFTLNYRLVIDGVPRHYSLKTIRGTGPDNKFIIIGVRNVDEQVRREIAMRAESETYAHIAKALASRYEVIYYIDIDSNHYIEYSSSEQYANLGVRKQGDDFFTAAFIDIKEFIHPEDCSRLIEELQREKFLAHLSVTGSLTLTYRQFLDGRSQYVSMMAVKPKNDPHHVVIGVVNIDDAKRREIAFREALGNAIDIANHDPLTSVRNKHAYLSLEAEMDEKISTNEVREFAIAIFDINGLKEVNDKYGHIAGDEFIISACKIICSTFKHSPVFRIGGDEFAVILMSSDYKNRGILMGQMDSIVRENKNAGKVTVACGISAFERGKDNYMREVFERADSAMYRDKKLFKEARL